VLITSSDSKKNLLTPSLLIGGIVTVATVLLATAMLRKKETAGYLIKSCESAFRELQHRGAAV
jgi:hypothetical protein